ncbi:hypothetical protein HYDPIDRAFT_106329 [Hydnomerulius pinastri MD-312]|nr:hypothetical protein HYDPIDRAFT_106329 [Hydnomerulius pinastri MD-312]
MPREIYVIWYHDHPFPAHWSLFIPSLAAPRIGKVLHATGSVASGFELQIKRNYEVNVRADGKPVDVTRVKEEMVSLGEIADEDAIDTPGDGTYVEVGVEGVCEGCRIEKAATEVPMPTKSLNSGIGGKGARVKVKNCQDWIQDLVRRLVNDKVLPVTAMDVLGGVSK